MGKSEAATGLGEPPRRTLKASERTARAIVKQIRDHGLEEGDRLPVERDMIEMYGVSRTTVREALRLLETLGVITIRLGPTGGPVIRRPRPGELGASLALMLEFEDTTMAAVIEARNILEPAVARLAARDITPEGLRQLEETIASQRALTSEAVWVQACFRFHRIIAEACANTPLRICSETMTAVAEAALEFEPVPFDTFDMTTVNEHERIFAALAVHDADEAEAAMRAHVQKGSERFQARAADVQDRQVRWDSAEGRGGSGDRDRGARRS